MIVRDTVWKKKDEVEYIGASYIRIDRFTLNLDVNKAGYIFSNSDDGKVWYLQTVLAEEKAIINNYDFIGRIDIPENDRQLVEVEKIEKEPETNRLSKVIE